MGIIQYSGTTNPPSSRSPVATMRVSSTLASRAVVLPSRNRSPTPRILSSATCTPRVVAVRAEEKSDGKHDLIPIHTCTHFPPLSPVSPPPPPLPLAPAAPSTTPTETEDEPMWVRREKIKEAQANDPASGGLSFGVYLLFSAIVAIAAVGSIFELSNQNAIFGVLPPDSPLYTPILGTFAVTGLPTSGYLFYLCVKKANADADMMDRIDRGEM